MKLDALIEQVSQLAKRNREQTQVEKPIRIMVGLGVQAVMKILQVDLKRYFQDPDYYLEYLLRQKLFYHEHFPDVDNSVNDLVGFEINAITEASLFGPSIEYHAGKYPELKNYPIIAEYKDLEQLSFPDFFESGAMPVIHTCYQRFKELVGESLTVTFPVWTRGPWSMAWFLRGFEALSYDVSDAPDFVHQLMDFLVAARIQWENDRAQFLGEDVTNKEDRAFYIYPNYRHANHADIYEDEVDGNLFSPRMYKKFIFPYEKALAEFHGGARYYHSCGNLTPLLNTLKKLPGLEKFHVSPWTDLKTSREKMAPGVRLQKCMKEEDIFASTEMEIRQQIAQILDDNQGGKLDICADAIHHPDFNLEQLQAWVRIVNDAVME